VLPPMIVIQSKFIGEFKIGDNINHNLKALALLYGHYAAGNQEERRLLCKPIIVMLVSIIDAVLYDLHARIREFTREDIRNVIASSVERIRRMKKMDKLEKYIKSANEHGLLEPAGNHFYSQLDELRKLRNRVHIQNRWRHLPLDEYNAFDESKKLKAEKAVEKTLRIMARKFERKHDYVAEFVLPWEPHYPD
jgi:hypothetical protein